MDFPNTPRRLGATLGIVAPPPPIGEPTFDGNFANPDANVVGTINLLPSMSATLPKTEIVRSTRASRFAGATGLTINAIETLTANSTPMGNPGQFPVGSQGVLGLDGAMVNSTPVSPIRAASGANDLVPKLTGLDLWQMSNGKMDAFVRIAGPIAAIYLWSKGQQLAAAVAAAPAAYLWYNRLKRK